MIFERGHFKSSNIQKSLITEIMNESRMFSATKQTTTKPTVFLSHKHKDLDDAKEVDGFIEVLEDLGAKIYIDSIDNKMPGQTSGETAKRLKEVIKFTNKFILLATEKAIESYWCNWELGLGDTHKYIEHIAILPIKDKEEKDSNYKGNEYLQIYPSIDYKEGTDYYRGTKNLIDKGYYYCTPRDKDGRRNITPLKQWLNQK